MSAPNHPRPMLHALVGDGLMADSIRGAATAGTRPLVALSFAALVALSEELGGAEAAASWLLDLANEVGRPIAINIPAPGGNSTTQVFAPFGWTQERLRGYVAGFAPELEASFGTVGRLHGGGGR